MHDVAIIGAGVGGITAAAKLQEAGIQDFVILERAHDVGGTWRDNTYPGIGVDIPSISYQFAFSRNRRWSRMFARGDEVQSYLRQTASDLGLEAKLIYGAEVVREIWDEDEHVWRLHTATGEVHSARFVISARGPFVSPKTDPGIPGLGDFAGKLQRPASWDHHYDLRGKRVVVIGTGASSVQLIPSIVEEVGHLTVFQRTPSYVWPKPDVTFAPPVQWALGLPPIASALHLGVLTVTHGASHLLTAPRPLARVAGTGLDNAVRSLYRGYLRLAVDDVETRRALTPRYGLFGKRPTMINGFVQAFNRDNVALVTTPIERIVAHGIKTTDGVVHQADVLVLATGYRMHNEHEAYPPGSIVGAAGFDQGDHFRAEGVHAYESVAVAGIPNRWMTSGPLCWTGGPDWFSAMLVSSTHVARALAEAKARGATRVEVTQEAYDRHKDEVARRIGTIADYFARQQEWGVNNYWINSQGDVAAIRPVTILESRRRAKSFSFDDYDFQVLAPKPRKRMPQKRGTA